MADTVKTWLLMFAINLPVYFLWGWVLFHHWADFWNAIDFGTETESRSWDDEEYWHDAYGEAKLAIWFSLPIGLIGLEMWLLGW
jgi:hypothetical protein